MQRRAPLIAIFFLVAGGALAAAIGGCSTLSDVGPGCANFVVEPELGEDCDESTAASPRDTGTARPARCAKIGEADACHYVADAAHDCPLGFRVGVGVGARVCVRAAGTFAAASPRVANLLGKSPRALDVDRDGQLDLVLDGVHDDFTAPYFLERRSDGRFEATVGAAEPLFATFADLSGDDVADVVAPAPDNSGLVVRLRHLDRSDEARIYERQATPGRLRYAWTPRADSSNDELVALFSDVGASSCGGGVCGRVVGRSEIGPSFSVPWLAPAALVGLQAAHARSGTLIATNGGLLRSAASADDMAADRWVSIPSTSYFGGVTLRDLDGDDLEDVGFVECVGELSFAVARGPFMFGASPLVESLATTPSSCLVRAPGPAFGFFDDDEIPDLVAGSLGLWTSSVGPTTGALGTDAQVLPLGPAAQVELYDVGDVSGDHRDDVVIAMGNLSEQPTTLAVSLGAEGAPLALVKYSMPLPIKELAIIDVDGNGVGDIVAVIGAGDAEDCEASLDEVLVAFGQASGYPEPFRSVGRFPAVEQITAGRWTPDDAYEVDAYGDLAISSYCAGGRGAILHGDPERRPFSILGLTADDGVPTDVLRVLPAPDLSAAIGRPSVVVTGLGTTGGRVAFVLPFTGRADPLPAERIELPLPAPTIKSGETLLQAISSRPEDPGAFVGAGLDVDEPKRTAILFAARAGGEVTDRLDVLHLAPASNATWSLASLPPTGLDPVRRYAFVARDVVAPELASGLFFFRVDEGGHFVDVAAAPPTGDGAFVGVTTLEGERGERILVVATDGGVYRVDRVTGTLSPFLAAGAPLAVAGVSAITAGDFSGDGLDDLLVIDRDGGSVVAQIAKTPAQ